MHPLTEYPRPAMRRDSYENLNGLWQYAITASAQRPAGWDGEILVPYAPECRASGVGRTLQPGQWLHYHRYFAPPAGTGGRVLLHFGAVDYACAVQVNGHLVGGHRGGYWPFTLDITAQLNGTGRNSLWVAVQDPTGHGAQARGKQTLQPGGMFYPAQSGIWQTVWLERVPENYIQSLTVTPDYDARTVTVKAHTSAPGGAANLWAVVRAGGVTIAEDWGSDEAGQDGTVTLHIADEYFFPWSPDTPFLYDLTVGTTQGEEEQFDTVHSYFALRKWSCAPDARGVLRFCLNDKPILLNGLLDQGYWPEGLYTPPSDAAVERELSEVKALGYNLLRKHAKIEPQRWYYHCDKLGLVVWQDMVNGGSKYNLWFVTYLTNVLQPLMRRLPDKAPLWELLRKLNAAQPEKMLASAVCQNENVLAAWEDGSCDVAVLPFSFAGATPFLQEQLFVCVPPEHALAKQSSLTFAEINGFNFLLRSELGFWDTLCREKMPASKFLVQTDTTVFDELVNASSLPCFTTDYGQRRLQTAYPGRVNIPLTDTEASVTFFLASRRKMPGL